MIRHEDMIEDGDKEPPGDAPDGELAKPAPAEPAEAPGEPAPAVLPTLAPEKDVDADSTPELTAEPPAPETIAPEAAEPERPVDALEPRDEVTEASAPSPPSSSVEPPPPETSAIVDAVEVETTDPAAPAAQSAPSLPEPVDAPAPAQSEAEAIAAAEAPVEQPPDPAATPESVAPAATTPPAPTAAPSVALASRLPDLLVYAGWRLMETLATLVVAALLIFVLLPTTTSPDWSALGERLTVTLPLVGLALLVAGALGIALGLLAIRAGGRAGGAIALLAELGTSLSPLVLGLILVLVVSGVLAWLPPGGFVPWEQDAAGALWSLVLPAASLGLPLALALAAAMWRAALPTLGGPAVSAAADRGLDRRAALREIVLPATWASVWPGLIVPLALLPVMALIVEAVFYLPGLSRLLLGAVEDRDAAGLQMALLSLAVLVAVCRLLGELLRGAGNPLLTDR